MRAFAVLVLLSGSATAATVTVDGTVFRDTNGDGIQQADEPGLAGITVSWEAKVFVTTGADGRYALAAPGDGIVWARATDGYVPTPTWRAVVVANGNQSADLGLRPSKPLTGPLSFLHASDSHIGIPEIAGTDVPTAFAIAGRLTPAPTFMVITGDVTQSETADQFVALRDALTEIDVPFVPVIGNHDLYQNGNEYRKALGPTQYSFETGGVHFMVLDHSRMNNLEVATAQGVLDFVRADIARSPPGMPTVVFTHAPQPDNLTVVLAQLGVTWMFTGHWHSNRLIAHGPLTEVTSTSPPPATGSRPGWTASSCWRTTSSSTSRCCARSGRATAAASRPGRSASWSRRTPGRARPRSSSPSTARRRSR